jgi:hypothetical protein
MHIADIGAVLFGVVIGWITYRTLIRQSGPVNVSDIATVLGAVGGAAVLSIFNSKYLFGLYALGLAIGFFAFFILFWILNGKQETAKRMGDTDPVQLS